MKLQIALAALIQSFYTMNPKSYLGDSVYAEFDGYAIVLTTENGHPTYPSNRIYLEPETLVALFGFARRVRKETGGEERGKS